MATWASVHKAIHIYTLIARRLDRAHSIFKRPKCLHPNWRVPGSPSFFILKVNSMSVTSWWFLIGRCAIRIATVATIAKWLPYPKNPEPHLFKSSVHHSSSSAASNHLTLAQAEVFKKLWNVEIPILTYNGTTPLKPDGFILGWLETTPIEQEPKPYSFSLYSGIYSPNIWEL